MKKGIVSILCLAFWVWGYQVGFHGADVRVDTKGAREAWERRRTMERLPISPHYTPPKINNLADITN